jgi:hypothetical protein
MFQPIGGMRKLPYPLYNQETNGNTTDDLGLTPNDFVWPEDPTERTVVPFYLSQQEFTAIASAVDVGADIAYPEQYIAVWWLLVRSLRYSVPICAQIIECIENDQDTKDAIVQMLIDNGEFNQYLNNTIGAIVGERLIEPLVSGSCDPATLMGKVKALVDRMNKTNEDFLEIIEVGTNDEEKLSALIEMVPGLNQEPIGDVIDFLQDILEDFTENYNAAITDARLLEIYCGLYCIAKGKDDCELNYTDVFDYFAVKVGSSLSTSSVLYDVVNFVLDGDFNTDDLIVDGMFMMQAGLVRTGGELAGMSLPSIALATIDAVPSFLFSECDECEEDVCYDFKLSKNGFLPNESWTLGEGFKRDDYRSRPDRLTILRNFSTNQYTGVTVYFNEPFTGFVDIRSYAGAIQQTLTFSGETMQKATFSARSSLLSIDCRKAANASLSSTLRLTAVCMTPA